MNRLPILRLAAVGVCTALLLAGCGRKGPLDPPPGAYGGQPEPARQQTLVPRPLAEPDTTAGERPVAAPGPQRRLPLDWLIN